MASPAWRAVTLDATGTLLRPRARIGATYVHAWEQFAALKLSSSAREAAEKAVDSRFALSFRRHWAQHENFGSGESSTAFPWWQRLVTDVFSDEDVFPAQKLSEQQQEPLARFLYAQFASADAWQVYDDVWPVLDQLKAQGVPLGVISNFDERLPDVLEGLGLVDYFDVVTSSFEHGVAKPHASIFEATFDKLLGENGGLAGGPKRYETCLHVGDHLAKDYEGARAAGASARLLIRHPESKRSTPTDLPSHQIVSTLEELLR